MKQMDFLDAPPALHNLTPREREREGLATGPAVDRPRLNKQCQAILERLKRGPAINEELSRMSLKYTSRLSDIRKAGYTVQAESMGGGVWRYTLKH